MQSFMDSVNARMREAGAGCPDGCGDQYWAVHDDTIMPDGRPLSAWIFEIDSLRDQKRDLADERATLKTWQHTLGIASWYVEQRPDLPYGDVDVKIWFRQDISLDSPTKFDERTLTVIEENPPSLTLLPEG